MPSVKFSTGCTLCPRLSAFLSVVREKHPDYYARPVPAFGDVLPRLLIVGLAPGMHGANRTGRPFTGDHAGILLYQTLFQFGWASQAEATHVDDGLQLVGCRITNAVKCLPPHNKPEPSEVLICNTYLTQEITALPAGAKIVVLGAIAHQAVLKALNIPLKSFKFSHGAVHVISPHLRLYDSYHCSRYNTQTKRLTPTMFAAVFAKIRADEQWVGV